MRGIISAIREYSDNHLASPHEIPRSASKPFHKPASRAAHTFWSTVVPLRFILRTR